MTQDRLSFSDTSLAFAVATAGVLGIAIGAATTANPFVISPSLDGTLTMLQLGFVLAILGGTGFRRTLYAMLPLLSILVIAAINQHESAWALAGATLTLYGVVGVGVSMLLRSDPADDNAPARA